MDTPSVPPKPRPIFPHYRLCPTCGHDESREVDRGESLATWRCKGCQGKFSLSAIGYEQWDAWLKRSRVIITP